MAQTKKRPAAPSPASTLPSLEEATSLRTRYWTRQLDAHGKRRLNVALDAGLLRLTIDAPWQEAAAKGASLTVEEFRNEKEAEARRDLRESIARLDRGDRLEGLWRPLIEWGDWFNEEPPRREYLLTGTVDKKTAGVLPLGKVGMLAAAGSAGKSWLATQLALAVATGQRWLSFDVANPGKVLLVLGEEDAEEAQRRLYHACQVMKLSREDRELARRKLWTLPMAGRALALMGEPNDAALQRARTQNHDEKRDQADGLPLTPFFWELLERLEETAGDDGWRLVLLDPLSRFASLEVETDNAQATRFVQVIERLAAVPGHPTVLVTHHTNKTARREGQSRANDPAAATAARGASGLTDGVRWQASLEPQRRYEGAPELVRFAVVKNNYGRYPPDLTLVREDGPLRTAQQSDIDAWNKAHSQAMAAEKAAKKAASGAGKGEPQPVPDDDDDPPRGDDWRNL